MIKKLSPIIGSALVCLSLVGCSLFSKTSTDDQKAADVQRLTFTAASIGTRVAIAEDTNRIPAFKLAYTNLDIVVTSKVIDAATLHSILATLPVKELKSPEAVIIIETATTLFDSYNNQSINLNSNKYVWAATVGIHDGIKAGLGY